MSLVVAQLAAPVDANNLVRNPPTTARGLRAIAAPAAAGRCRDARNRCARLLLAGPAYKLRCQALVAHQSKVGYKWGQSAAPGHGGARPSAC